MWILQGEQECRAGCAESKEPVVTGDSFQRTQSALCDVSVARQELPLRCGGSGMVVGVCAGDAVFESPRAAARALSPGKHLRFSSSERGAGITPAVPLARVQLRNEKMQKRFAH